MDDRNKEMIQNFADMANTVKDMTEPLYKELEESRKQHSEEMREERKHSTIKMILTNLFWAIVTFALVWFAYMTPIDSSQEQDFDEQTQSQSFQHGNTTSDYPVAANGY